MPKVEPVSPPFVIYQWHPYYRDTAGDAILASVDNIRFRCSQYRLADASPIFFSVFEAARKDASHGNPSTTPISTPFPAKIIEVFLELIGSYKFCALILDFEIACGLREMVEHYQCVKHKAQAELAFKSACAKQPLAAIRYASAKNDVVLARLAIGFVTPEMVAGNIIGDLSNFWAYVNSLRLEWRTPFLQAIMVRELDCTKKKHVTRVAENWSTLGPAFRP